VLPNHPFQGLDSSDFNNLSRISIKTPSCTSIPRNGKARAKTIQLIFSIELSAFSKGWLVWSKTLKGVVLPNYIELVVSFAAEPLVAKFWITGTRLHSHRQKFHHHKQEETSGGRSVVCDGQFADCVVSLDCVQQRSGEQGGRVRSHTAELQGRASYRPRGRAAALLADGEPEAEVVVVQFHLGRLPNGRPAVHGVAAGGATPVDPLPAAWTGTHGIYLIVGRIAAKTI
jgi:hypothetical protein